MKLENGKWEHTNYNSRFQPTQIGLGTNGSDSSVLRLDYGFSPTNNNGNILSQRIVISGSPGLDVTQNYTYDELNRLLSVTESNSLPPNSPEHWHQLYDYDRWGNRAVRTGSLIPNPALTPVSNSPASLATLFNQSNNRIAMSNFAYDAAGNLKQDPVTSPNPPAGMQYDAENRMISYTKPGTPTTPTATYSYDGDGHRVKKVDSSGTTIYVYDVAGQLTAEYHNDPVPPPAGGGGTSYLISDHLGSTRVVTNQNGGVKARYDFLPFGEELSSPTGGRAVAIGYGGADSTKQRFTQKERD